MARRSSRTAGRTWAIRATIAIGAGVVIGFATGVAVVRIMQPPGVAIADSAETDTTRKPRSGSNSAAGNAAGNADVVNDVAADTAPRAANGTLVPKLVGLEEGDARQAITRAGFTVGSVLFKSSSAPAGTVLSSFPVPGESVQLPATVNLILSDGRPRADSLGGDAHPDSVSLASTSFP